MNTQLWASKTGEEKRKRPRRDHGFGGLSLFWVKKDHYSFEFCCFRKMGKEPNGKSLFGMTWIGYLTNVENWTNRSLIIWAHCINHQETEMNDDSQLAFSLLFLQEPRPMGWFRSHSRWVFLLQLNHSGNTAWAHPELCFRGDLNPVKFTLIPSKSHFWVIWRSKHLFGRSPLFGSGYCWDPDSSQRPTVLGLC